jgi:UDP-N-acetylmuramyl pentapeptide synthase
MKPAVIQITENHQEIIAKIISELSPQDVILVKGSRQMKMEVIVEGLCKYVLSSALSVA